MGWYLLLITVAAGTAIWPVGKWALKDDAEPSVVGFWVSLTVAVIAAVAATLTSEWGGVPFGVIMAGITMGVAYAIGFWICTMRALQIGPSGPTVTINNMAMTAGVLYSMFVLKPGQTSPWTIAGLVGVCAALLLLGLGRPAENGVHRSVGGRRNVGGRWARLIAIGGAFSCLSFMAQAHANTLYIQHRFVFGTVTFGLSALLLLPGMLRQPSRFALRHELVGGLALGAINGGSMPFGFLAINLVGAEVALPVGVAMPILIVLLIGRVFYREHLSPAAWAACVVGAAAVAALALGSAT